MNQDDLRRKILETARSIGANPVDLATAISFESGFNPNAWGGSGGNYYGLIQFGPNERKQYGVDTNNPDSQLGANGAIANYMRDRGFKPGMSGLDLYSTINAGAPGKYGASDAANGGTPGDVQNKWETQMQAHRQKAEQLLSPYASMADGPKGQESYAPPVFGSMAPGAPQDNSIPLGVANYASGEDPKGGNLLQKLGAAFSAAAPSQAAPHIAAMPSPSGDVANGLLKLMKNPQALAQMMLQRRLA